MLLSVIHTHPRACIKLVCLVGNDARKAVSDGFPVTQVVASDIQAGFLDLGHKLFRSTPETCPITFVPGDVFNHEFIGPAPPATTSSESVTYPDIKSLKLTSLNPLRYKISAIHASSFFHLFDEEQQLVVAQRLASLLSPEPGSTIFGGHVGLEKKGWRDQDFKKVMFCHDPDTWNAVWEEVFGKGIVECKSFMHPDWPILIWSVTRC